RVQIGGCDLRGAAGVADELRELDLRNVHRIGSFAGTRTDAVVAEDIAWTRAAHIADAMSQEPRSLHHAAALGKINFHFNFGSGAGFSPVSFWFQQRADFYRNTRARRPCHYGCAFLLLSVATGFNSFWLPLLACGCCRTGR